MSCDRFDDDGHPEWSGRLITRVDGEYLDEELERERRLDEDYEEEPEP